MVSQIPELGLVIVGNQAGRVGILTATGMTPATKNERLLYTGYKIECILPDKSQEDQDLRPRCPLMGVAVGPIQGQENTPDLGSIQDMGQENRESQTAWGSSRRFRLLMIYLDHSVLSYEIERTSYRDTLTV